MRRKQKVSTIFFFTSIIIIIMPADPCRLMKMGLTGFYVRAEVKEEEKVPEEEKMDTSK